MAKNEVSHIVMLAHCAVGQVPDAYRGNKGPGGASFPTYVREGGIELTEESLSAAFDVWNADREARAQAAQSAKAEQIDKIKEKARKLGLTL